MRDSREEYVDVVRHDDADEIDSLLVLALQLQCSFGPLALGRGIRNWSLEIHVHGYLAEEARHFDGQLRVFEYSLATAARAKKQGMCSMKEACV